LEAINANYVMPHVRNKKYEIFEQNTQKQAALKPAGALLGKVVARFAQPKKVCGIFIDNVATAGPTAPLLEGTGEYKAFRYCEFRNVPN
jgi:hypothetical protein